MIAPAPHEQPQAAALLLCCILGGQPDALVELRAIDRTSGAVTRREWHADAPRAVESARTWSSGLDVYVGALPRFTYGGGRAALRDGARLVWADADCAAAVQALKGFPVAPSFLIRSGGQDCGQAKLHAWWLLCQPLTLAAVEHVNRALAQGLGADRGACDAPRVLRLPGTLNHKTDPPRPVECAEVGEATDVHELVRALPQALPVQCGRGDRPHRLTPLHALEPHDYVERLTGRVVAANGKVTCPFHGGGKERTPSLHCYPTAADGWYCFACGTGGDIFDFAGRLWGLSTRWGFIELKRRLEAALVGGEVAA